MKVLGIESSCDETGVALIDSENADYAVFCAALNEVTTALCRMIAKDGEGASRLTPSTRKSTCTEHTAAWCRNSPAATISAVR